MLRSVAPAFREIDSWSRACGTLYTKLAPLRSRHIAANVTLSRAFEGFEVSPLAHHAKQLFEAILLSLLSPTPFRHVGAKYSPT